MYKPSCKPIIHQLEDYDRINGLKNHRIYSNLQNKLHRQVYPELYLDDVELYDKHLYRKYLLEEAAEKEEKDLDPKQNIPLDIGELIARAGQINRQKTDELIQK